MGVKQERLGRILVWVPFVLLGTFLLASVPLWVGTQVNAVAFLAGAEKQGTFIPVTYRQICGKGCHVATDGFVQHTGERLTWQAKVPLGKPFRIWLPVTNWGGAWLVEDNGAAIGDLIFTFVIECSSIVLGILFLTRGRLRVFRAMERRFSRTSRPTPLRPRGLGRGRRSGWPPGRQSSPFRRSRGRRRHRGCDRRGRRACRRTPGSPGALRRRSVRPP